MWGLVDPARLPRDQSGKRVRSVKYSVAARQKYQRTRVEEPIFLYRPRTAAGAEVFSLDAGDSVYHFSSGLFSIFGRRKAKQHGLAPLDTHTHGDEDDH